MSKMGIEIERMLDGSLHMGKSAHGGLKQNEWFTVTSSFQSVLAESVLALILFLSFYICVSLWPSSALAHLHLSALTASFSNLVFKGKTMSKLMSLAYSASPQKQQKKMKGRKRVENHSPEDAAFKAILWSTLRGHNMEL